MISRNVNMKTVKIVKRQQKVRRQTLFLTSGLAPDRQRSTMARG